MWEQEQEWLDEHLVSGEGGEKVLDFINFCKLVLLKQDAETARQQQEEEADKVRLVRMRMAAEQHPVFSKCRHGHVQEKLVGSWE